MDEPVSVHWGVLQRFQASRQRLAQRPVSRLLHQGVARMPLSVHKPSMKSSTLSLMTTYVGEIEVAGVQLKLVEPNSPGEMLTLC